MKVSQFQGSFLVLFSCYQEPRSTIVGTGLGEVFMKQSMKYNFLGDITLL